ncbi:MAG: oligoribonuclease NrnB/cAMP/cGMP phosphodiesterase (DHH superfamily) [Candidatus Azotimanducaceae bacterium]|jgi:oligoribonuclease NrnB/cAMP/cGMP phosphodiesterase (DHH superfamily)
METTLKNIVIIYHGNCRDGFGAAYAAWKKFADTASYIPCKNQEDMPEGLTDKEIYIVDYSYSKEVLQKLVDTNKSVVVIDHHASARDAVESFDGNIFDNDHSGAVLAWKYFHPDLTVPPLLEYVEDHDLWRFSLPENREFCVALGLYPMDFESWDVLIEKLKYEDERINFIAKGALIAKFEDKIVDGMMEYKERVLFEGSEVWALNVSRTYRSILGNRLAGLNLQEEQTPIGIVYYRYGGHVHISLRSHGDADVMQIARKYGGGGHKNAAAFRVDSFNDLPFTFV